MGSTPHTLLRRARVIVLTQALKGRPARRRSFGPMFVLALLAFVLAVSACVVAIRKSARVLGLDLMQALLWLGLAETPAPQTRRRT